MDSLQLTRQLYDEDEEDNCGAIFRSKANGKLRFVCFHCGLDFHSFEYIRNHIEDHFLSVKFETNIVVEDLVVAELLQCPEKNIQPERNELDLGASSSVKQELVDIKVESKEAITASDDNISEIEEEDDEEEEEEEERSEKKPVRSQRRRKVRQFQCDICKEIFSNKFSIKTHMRMHNDNKRAVAECKFCSRIYVKSYIREHVRAKHPEEYDKFVDEIKIPERKEKFCKLCEKQFPDSYTYKNHMDMHANLRQFVCKVCNAAFNTAHILNLHTKRHIQMSNRNLKCTLCPYITYSNVALKNHMMNHTGHRPHKCETCGKGFARKCELKVHDLSHTGEKPFQCSICGVSFITLGKMNMHSKRRHTNTEKPFKCTMCDKKFFTEYYRLKHEVIHSGVRPFHCDVCGKDFSSRRNLRNHSFIHREKQYKCKFCDMAFAQTSGRRIHEKNKHLSGAI